MGKNEVVSTCPQLIINFRGYPDHFTEKLLHNHLLYCESMCHSKFKNKIFSVNDSCPYRKAGLHQMLFSIQDEITIGLNKKPPKECEIPLEAIF